MVWKISTFCILSMGLTILVAAAVLVWFLKYRSNKEKGDKEDQYWRGSASAMEELKRMMNNGSQPPEISEEKLNGMYRDKIGIAAWPFEKDQEIKIEGYQPPAYKDYKFPNFPPITLRALYESGVSIPGVKASWPPGMYNKAGYWYPGFATSGWSWWLAPMMKYGPQGFWIRNKGGYYYINNYQ